MRPKERSLKIQTFRFGNRGYKMEEEKKEKVWIPASGLEMMIFNEQLIQMENEKMEETENSKYEITVEIPTGGRPPKFQCDDAQISDGMLLILKECKIIAAFKVWDSFSLEENTCE